MIRMRPLTLWVLAAGAAAFAGPGSAQPTAETEQFQRFAAQEFLQDVTGGNARQACGLVAPLGDGSRVTTRELGLYMRELYRFQLQSNVQVPEGADVTFEPLWEPITICVAFIGDGARGEQLVDLERTVKLALGLDDEAMAALRRSIGREAGTLNVKDLCLAAIRYSMGHGNDLPSAATWTDATGDFLDSKEYLRCPATVGAELRFAFNAALDGVSWPKLADPAQTVVFFSSDLPGDSPAGGAADAAADADDMVYLGFADGHVQLMRRANVPPALFDPVKPIP